jgi:hypothetical protein
VTGEPAGLGKIRQVLAHNSESGPRETSTANVRRWRRFTV